MGNVPIIAYEKPSNLRFTHDLIDSQFSDGRSLEESFRQIIFGDVLVSRKTMPPLVVMFYAGDWYVVKGNRRLYLLRKLEENGFISKVKVVRQPFDGFILRRNYSTTCSGLQANVKNRPFFDKRLNKIVREWRDEHGGMCTIL